jgi:hypothetical protein
MERIAPHFWNVQYSTAARLPGPRSTQKRHNKHQQGLTPASGISDVSISSVSAISIANWELGQFGRYRQVIG